MPDTPSYNTLGTYIKSRRRILGKTQEEVASLLDAASAQNISNWERDVDDIPEKHLGKIIIHLELDVKILSQLMARKEQSKHERHLSILVREARRHYQNGK
jgi:transcriptional regulator with XRE-family HTH domain